MEEINNFQQEPDETIFQAWERFKELLMKCPQHYLTEMQENQQKDTRKTLTIQASTDAAIRNQGASTKTLEIQIGQISKVLQKRGFRSLPSSTETNPIDQVKSISTTIEANSHSIRRIGSPQYAKGSYRPQFSKAYSKASHIDESIPQKEKDPRSFTLPSFINNVCFDNALVKLGASVSVMPLLTYLNLGLGELAHTKLTVELADRTVKYPKGIAKNVLVRIGKFTFPVDFIILDMPKDIKVTLILGRPFLSTAHAKIDVYKRKITLRLRRNQGDDLIPTIEEGEVIEEFRTRDEDLDTGIDYYPKDMDAYHDEGMGNVIVGEPFFREVGIKARQIDGMITIYNGNDDVTYQNGAIRSEV
ncbi:hypothetical protein Tco_0111772 [Tanacetum coccineum]